MDEGLVNQVYAAEKDYIALKNHYEMYATAELQAVLDRLRSAGVPEVVVKLATPACHVVAAGVDDVIEASPVPDVVDTTAAGDSFAAAYLAARLSRRGPADAARAGLLIGVEKFAALTLTGTDAFKAQVVRLAVVEGLAHRIANPELQDRIEAERSRAGTGGPAAPSPGLDARAAPSPSGGRQPMNEEQRREAARRTPAAPPTPDQAHQREEAARQVEQRAAQRSRSVELVREREQERDRIALDVAAHRLGGARRRDAGAARVLHPERAAVEHLTETARRHVAVDAEGARIADANRRRHRHLLALQLDDRVGHCLDRTNRLQTLKSSLGLYRPIDQRFRIVAGHLASGALTGAAEHRRHDAAALLRADPVPGQQGGEVGPG